MSSVRVIPLSYIEFLKKMLSKKDRDMILQPSSCVAIDILKDLPRQPFFPSKGRTYKDHIASWMSPTVSKIYAQGNMNSLFYTNTLLNYFLLESPQFIKLVQGAETLSRCEDNRQTYAFSQVDKVLFGLSYFDDEGIPCGFSIAYSKFDPTLWTAAIFRNTSADPEKREVIIFSPEEIIDLKKEGLMSASQAASTFLKSLNSQELQTKLGQGFLLADGKVDITKVEDIRSFANDLSQHYSDEIVPLIDAHDALNAKYEKNKNPELEAVAKQSFFGRHAKSMAVAALGFAVLISTALIVTGVLAPLGLVLAGGIAITLGAAVSASAGAAVVGSGIKIALDERNLSQYQLSRDKQYHEIRSKISEAIESRSIRAPSNTGHDSTHNTVLRPLLSSSPSQALQNDSKEENPIHVDQCTSIAETNDEPQVESREPTQTSIPTGRT